MAPANKDIVQELQEILKQWEEDQAVSTNDPTPHLIALCEHFERETIIFLKQDPDPFDDRHPVTQKPDCALGLSLRALFKKDTFITKLVNHYLRETYFSGLGFTKDPTDLNTAACRLLLDLLYGLDIPQVFRDAEATVLRLYNWAEKGPEPLQSYATGLLAAAMDIADLPTSFKEQNAHLIPIMLKRLWDLKNQGESDTEEKTPDGKIPDRPFAHLNSLGKAEKEPLQTDHKRKRSHKEIFNNSAGSLCNSSKKLKRESLINHTSMQVDAVENASILSSDCSNSSWAEIGSYIVGRYQIFPITKETKEMFILKYLKPVSEYQESLTHIYEHRALDLVFHYIDIRQTDHSRLSFEALRFLGSLLFHKKFCIEFVCAREGSNNLTGIHKLIKVPRPSLPADGVALCLWYLAFCEEAVEKICQLPDLVVSELVKCALWLLECSHQSSRTHAVMFFGIVFKYKAILVKFDDHDGLRRLVNMLSTLSFFQDNWEQEIADEPNENIMWQTIKHVCSSIKSYFDAHLCIKGYDMHVANSSTYSVSSSGSAMSSFHQFTPPCKPMNMTPDSVLKNVEFLLEHLRYGARWVAVDKFVHLKGLNILIQLVNTISNEPLSPNRSDTAVSALSSLYICSVMPQVQSALCDKLSFIPSSSDEFLEDGGPQEVTGYDVLVTSLTISENYTANDSIEIQKAALKVLVNCLCAPIHKLGGAISRSVTQLVSSSTAKSAKKLFINASEETLKKSWDCVRTSNGIMNLINLLHKKTPITDADYMRAMSCRALVGLARSDIARQIMSKLPIFASGQLQILMKEPILQEKRTEFVAFQRHALELTKLVSGLSKSQDNASTTDGSMSSIHKADVVAQTKIGYNKEQLLQLIYNFLSQEGYESVAAHLQKDAALPLLPAQLGGPMGPPMAGVSTPSPPMRTRLLNSVRVCSPLVRSPFPCAATNRDNPGTATISSPQTPTANSHSSIHLKINRSNRKVSCAVTGTPLSANIGSPLTINTATLFSKTEKPSIPMYHSSIIGTSSGHTEPGMSLDKIVVEYLANQHALCKNPVITCPTFDLFQPHQCPVSKAVKSASTNFTMRYVKQSYGLNNVRDVNRKFIYSRYRPSHIFKAAEDIIFLTCEFMPDEQNVVVGTTKGEIQLYNRYSDSVVVGESVHRDLVTSLSPHQSGSLLLSSCSYNNDSMLWRVSDTLENKFVLHESHADFSNSQDKILGTTQHIAKLYDINTCQVISEFAPKLSNHYAFNKAALDPSDDILLTDGVLYDVRSGKQIHKFDKINPSLNGRFHRNGLEVISSAEIWDLRTYHLLRTVPMLAMCNVYFNYTGDVMFGINVGLWDETENNDFETSFTALDSSDYSSIATVDVKKIVCSLAINRSDTQIAVVEKEPILLDEFETSSVVKLYDIGMMRQEDDDPIDDDDEDDETDDSDDDEEDERSITEYDPDDLDVDDLDDRNSDEDIEIFSVEVDSSSDSEFSTVTEMEDEAAENVAENNDDSEWEDEEEEEEEMDQSS